MRKAAKTGPGVSVAGGVKSTMTNPMKGKRPSGAKVGRMSGKRSMGRGR